MIIRTLLPLLILCLISCKDTTKDISDIPFPCIDGMSDGTFPCDNIDMYAHVGLADLQATTNAGGVYVNDIWGWTDPETNKEYALVGLADGVTFVDVTDPAKPIVIGFLPETSVSSKYKVPNYSRDTYAACFVGIGEKGKAGMAKGSIWRDMKVYKNHMFVVSDAQAHGMEVFDLTKLRQYSGTFITFSEDALYDKIANAHNIVINEDSGFAYIVGSYVADTCATAGLHIVDIKNPKQPTFTGCYEDKTPPRLPNRSFKAGAYIHDAQCVIYSGPDSDYTGKEVCFNGAERSFVIADVSDKKAPTTISYATHPDLQYSHQGWLTEDQKYFLLNDELDEYNLGRNTKTYVYDVKDLDNPTFVGYYEHDTFSIDHNLYIKGNYVYESNYKSGLRILKLNNLAKASMSTAGFFDTYPNDNNRTEPASHVNDDFFGTWSNYPFFKSGTIIVSDIDQGLFILKAKL